MAGLSALLAGLAGCGDGSGVRADASCVGVVCGADANGDLRNDARDAGADQPRDPSPEADGIADASSADAVGSDGPTPDAQVDGSDLAVDPPVDDPPGEAASDPPPEASPADPSPDAAVDPPTDPAVDPAVDSAVDLAVDPAVDPAADPAVDLAVDPSASEPQPEVIDAPSSGTWMSSWGGNGQEVPTALAVGADGSIILAGTFSAGVDFDPWGGIDYRTPVGGTDAFVTKFGPEGQYYWTRTWGGADNPFGESPHALAVAGDGSILVAGQYCAMVDFDPGPGTDIRTSGGCFDAFLTKLTHSGDVVWARTWGATGRDRAAGVGIATDGSIFVAGQFESSVDMDPGAGVSNRSSNGLIDVYVTKLDGAGNFAWSRSWGGSDTEYNAGSLAVAGTSVVVGGCFRNTVDFDPGAGVDMRTAVGSDDLFLSKLDADGNLVWARTFGGTAADLAGTVSAGSAFFLLSGTFNGMVDFDPGPGTDTRTAAGTSDGFVTSIQDDGAYGWTRTWGGTGTTQVRHVGVAQDGRILVSGNFTLSTDMNPGTPTLFRSSVGALDAFLVVLDANAAYVTSRTWGNPYQDFGIAAADGGGGFLVFAGSYGSISSQAFLLTRFVP